MYDIKWIRDNPEVFDKGQQKRGLEPLATRLLELDKIHRAAIAASQETQKRRNDASNDIRQAMSQKNLALAEELKSIVVEYKDLLKEL